MIPTIPDDVHAVLSSSRHRQKLTSNQLKRMHRAIEQAKAAIRATHVVAEECQARSGIRVIAVREIRGCV